MKNYLVIFAIAFTAGETLSQNVIAPQEFPHFNQIENENGFPGYEVYDIDEDSSGYKWFATDNGVFRYDGYTFYPYDNPRHSTKNFPEGNCLSIESDQHNNLWLGIGKYICRYRDEFDDFEIHEVVHSVGRKFFITQIAEGRNDCLWLAGESNEVIRFDTHSGQMLFFQITSEEQPCFVHEILDVSDSETWFATSIGMIRFNPNTRESILFNTLPNSLFKDGKCGIITSMEVDPISDQKFWLGTWGNGIILFDKSSGKMESFTFEKDQPVNLSNIIFDLSVKNNHELWIGSHLTGAFHLESKSFVFYDPDRIGYHGAIDTEVRCIHRDANDLIWIGTATGVMFHDPLQQQFTFRTIGNQNVRIGGIIDDPKRDQFVSFNVYHNRQLYFLDRQWNVKKTIPIPHVDLERSEIMSLFHFKPKDEFWIGTTKSGLIVYDNHTQTYTETLKGNGDLTDLSNIRVMDIVEDETGMIWLATSELGVISYDPKSSTFKAFTELTYLRNGTFVGASKLLRDHQNKMWCFSDGSGYCRFDPRNPLQGPLHVSELSDIRDLAIGPNDELITTSNSNGIRIYSEADNFQFPFKKIDTSTGAPTSHFQSITLDQNQHVWISYQSGILELNQQFDIIKIHSSNSGLFGNLSFSYVIAPNPSTLAVPFSNGLFIHNHVETPLSKVFPTVLNNLVINDTLTLNTAPQSIQQLQQFKHDENTITIGFANLDFTHSSEILYSFQLSGLEETWSTPSAQRIATYRDLPPGEYTFQVRTSQGDGKFGDPTSLIHFEILPAWWQTWIFRISISLLLLAIGFVLVRYFTTRKLRRELKELQYARNIERIRNRIARDIHDEVGAGLTKISLMTYRLEQNEVSTKIQQASREIIDNMGDIVWAVNPENDSLTDLVAFIRELSVKYFEDSSIQSTRAIAEVTPTMNHIRIHPEVKRNVILVLKEALHNVVKHSNASAVHISLVLAVDLLTIKIKDNGNGFDVNTVARGNGLKNMQKRMEEIGGIYGIETSPNGTAITLSVHIFSV